MDPVLPDEVMAEIWELYGDLNLGSLWLRIGKQQIVWGRTDLFRVLDVLNPVDYSRNNIYDELEDIRIPMWMFTGAWLDSKIQMRTRSFIILDASR